MVEIRVGKVDIKSFYAHKDLLTSRSAFFAAALKGHASSDDGVEIVQWKEGVEGVIRMPDDEPQVFAAYMHLIYHGTLPISANPKRASPPATPPHELASARTTEMEEKQFKRKIYQAIHDEYNLLTTLYIFSDKIQDSRAKHSLLRAFVEATRRVRADETTRFPSAPAIQAAYEGTTPMDPLRQFLVDCYVLVGHRGWAGTSAGEFPAEFLFDVVVGMYEERGRPRDTKRVEDAAYYCERLWGGNEEEDTWWVS